MDCSNGIGSRFLVCLYATIHNVEVMQQTILFKVPGKPSTRPLVILTGLDIEASSTKSLRYAKNSTTPVSVRLSRALSSAWSSSLATLRSAKKWTRCNCTPVRIVRAVFSAKVSTAVAIIAGAAMWWHDLTIADTIEAQRAVGLDGLLAMPWAIVWAFRASRMPMPEEGGEE